MHVTLHRPGDLTELKQRRRQERDALLALEGQQAPAIARTLGRSRRFVQQWVYRYRDHGLEAVGLRNCHRRKRSPSGSVSWPNPPRPTASVPCGPKRPNAFSRRSSQSNTLCPAFTICSIAWGCPV